MTIPEMQERLAELTKQRAELMNQHAALGVEKAILAMHLNAAVHGKPNGIIHIDAETWKRRHTCGKLAAEAPKPA